MSHIASVIDSMGLREANERCVGRLAVTSSGRHLGRILGVTGDGRLKLETHKGEVYRSALGAYGWI